MMAIITSELRVDGPWSYEMKWDGYGAELLNDAKRTRPISRKLKKLTYVALQHSSTFRVSTTVLPAFAHRPLALFSPSLHCRVAPQLGSSSTLRAPGRVPE
jgi:hypothetical protein